jgi:hypothetical protein
MAGQEAVRRTRLSDSPPGLCFRPYFEERYTKYSLSRSESGSPPGPDCTYSSSAHFHAGYSLRLERLERLDTTTYNLIILVEIVYS